MIPEQLYAKSGVIFVVMEAHRYRELPGIRVDGGALTEVFIKEANRIDRPKFEIILAAFCVHSNNDRSKRVPKDKFSNQNVQTQVFKKVPHKCANMCQQVVFVVVVVLVVVVVVVVCACVCVLSNKVFQHNTHTILQKRFYTFKTFSNVFVLILQKTNQA